MATIREQIDYVNALKTNTFTDTQKLGWINEVEQSVKEEVMRTFLSTSIQRIANTSEYSLPTGVVFEDIETVYFNGKEADKLDQRSFLDGTTSGDTGYFKPTTSNKIAVNPTPTVSDDSATPLVKVIYLEKFTPYTSSNSYGTTLLITKPQHLKVYTFYLMAQMALHNKEYEDYNNQIIQFNSAWKDFANWYMSRQPVSKSAVVRNIW